MKSIFAVALISLTLAHAAYAETSQETKLISHKEILYSCDDGHLVTHTYVWDEIKNPETALTQRLNKENHEPFSKDEKNFSRQKTACTCSDDESPEDCKNPYSTDASNQITLYGAYLIGVEKMDSEYTGGAHPMEGGKLVIYDMRTNQIVPFLNLFSPHGQDLLLARIKSDLSNDFKDSDLKGCNIEMNDVWHFGQKNFSYIPWRTNVKMLDGKHDPKDIKSWNIAYGTYAFGCTGRPGYEMYGLPDEVVEKELNTKYFDPNTHYFYEQK